MQPYSIMTDRELLQIMCAFRIFFPEIEISLSTRESATFRDHVSPILANNISAGSKTNPGGYITSKTELEQFYPQDNRSPKEMPKVRLILVVLDVLGIFHILVVLLLNMYEPAFHLRLPSRHNTMVSV
uniref:Biotin and thiamin synthesis-associated domain-containing protein n=1 Tax=Glossina palpalis gambiensis TaxID=67801 RepID=A0A1B0C480_9MUSC